VSIEQNTKYAAHATQVERQVEKKAYTHKPKWQKNDLVPGGHGQAGSWCGK